MPLMATDHDGTSSEIFWGEIAPCEHMVQIYCEDSAFLDALEGFTAGGLRGGEGVVVIATPAHLAALKQRLTTAGLDMDLAVSQERYIALDADRTLGKFMMRGWP